MSARLRTGALLVAALAVLTWGTAVAQRGIYPQYADSDTVWLVGLAVDLFERGGTWAGWNLSPHPNFFPEFLIVDLARRLSSSLEGFFFGFGLANVVCLFLVSWLGLHFHLRARSASFTGEPRSGERVADSDLALLGALVVVGGTLAAFDLGLFARPLRYAFLPAYHFPPVWVAMLVAFLAIDQFDREITWGTFAVVGVAALLMLATGLSDKAVVLNTLPGLVVAAVYQTIRAGRAEAVAWATGPVIGAGAVGQLLTEEVWNRFAGVSSYPLSIDTSQIGQQGRELLRALFIQRTGRARHDVGAWIETGVSVLITIAIVVLAVWLLGMLVRSLRAPGHAEPTRTKAESFEAFLIFAPILVTAAILVLASFENLHFLRLVIPLFHFLPLAIVMHALGRWGPRIRPAAFRACFAGVLLALGAAAWMSPPAGVASPVPPLLACIERNAAQYDLRHGLGHHWQSHLPTVASGHRVLVRPIESDGAVIRWHNDIDWYGSDATRPGFTFVVVTPTFNLELLDERLGPPTHKLACPETGEAAAPEYAAWSPSAREESEIWVYEGAAQRRLNQWIRLQHDLAMRRDLKLPAQRDDDS